MNIIEIRELKANENMVLTNGQVWSSIGGSIFLGINDSPNNWWEITAEEAKQQQEKLLLEEEILNIIQEVY